MMTEYSGAAAAAVLLAANSVVDIRSRKIALLPTLAALGTAAALRIGSGSGALLTAARLTSSAMCGIVLLAASAASGGRIGAGDGILMLAVGVMTDGAQAAATLFFGLASVLMWALLQRLRKTPQKEVPFVPFLFAGFLIQRSLFT